MSLRPAAPASRPLSSRAASGGGIAAGEPGFAQGPRGTAPILALLSGDRDDRALLGQFSIFYSELLRLCHALSGGARLAGREGVDPTDLPGFVHHRLRTLLEDQGNNARALGGTFGETLYREAQYVMAALADEVMLFRLRWDGHEAWREKLLEGALFGTAIAGERIFDRMDELLEDGGRFHPDLATIYLVALALGFRGRYWRREDDGVLRLYRTALARVVTRHDPDLVAERAHLFAPAYDFTINDGRSVRLPHLKPWIAGGIALVLVFLIAARLLWFWTTDVLTHEMASIPAAVSSDE